MRYFKWAMVIFCALVLVAPTADAAPKKRKAKQNVAAGNGTRDERYAALILNPITGEVYHEANADARRYPASLTKMMTLYLLFEALEKGKTTMDARMDVSDYAATMPRTNLSLDAGDSVPVETAIKSLIVLSANDVSVVVAEALGGSVERFADMMTAKARALGMRNTVFQNPHGLPNSEQYTTARDMAKLGIALKRDFPRYYNYFQTRQFSWAGATYYTHNRVMLRYEGTDGIKTGFIGASGFNLVSSVTRGGRPLVGVVMGGASGGWRDNRMISLLDTSYKTIAERGAVRGKVVASNLPLAKNGAAGNAGISVAQAASDVLVGKDDASLLESSETEDIGVITSSVEVPVFSTKPENPMMALKPNAEASAAVSLIKPAPPMVVTNSPAIPPKPLSPFAAAVSEKTAVKVAKVDPVITTKPSAMPAKPAPAVAAKPAAAKAPMSAEDVAWGIQVGAFSTQELAQQAAQKALQIAAVNLSAAKISVMGPTVGGAAVHRARLENLPKINAIKACEKLISNNSPCFIYRAEPAKL